MAAIKGNQTVNEINSEFGTHASIVTRWKKEAIEALPLVFGNSKAKQTKEAEVERDRLYQKVGKLQVELDWFKKKHRASLMTIKEKKQHIQPRHPELKYPKAM